MLVTSKRKKMKYYFGGYCFMKMQPLKFGSHFDSLVYSASDCINDNLVGTWAYTWTTNNNAGIDQIKNEFLISDNTVSEIRQWIDKKFEEKKIGWHDLFAEIETVIEYKQKFYSHLTDLKIFALYFNEAEANCLIQEFNPIGDKEGAIGLHQILSEKIVEKESVNEKTIGFDLIGVEFGGDFHSFHCHDLGKNLSVKFGLTLNNSGLFEPHFNWKPVLDYLNNEENGFEPVPWFVVKVNLITIE